MPKLGMEPVRRAEAINAALECICDSGIDQITLDMVAAKGGFSKGIVAYYFKSKRQLILECLKAFMASYGQKSMSMISADMTPARMLDTLVDVSLPPLSENNPNQINVSNLAETSQINLPESKMMLLSLQFISKAVIDEEFRNILKEANDSDVASIAWIFSHARQGSDVEGQDAIKAYSLLAMLYGLSFFRVMGHLPPGLADNREIGFNYARQLLARC